MPPFVRPIRRLAFPFYHQARCSAVRVEIDRVDHHRVALESLGRNQPFHHPQEHALIAPPLAERLVWPGILRRIPPAQPFAANEDNPAQNPSIIYSRLAVALR
ncbi:hypothetical protein MBESOW_P3741 [Sphingobium xenophagum]|uniref:Uncharacterized protein n=1 Tax=Sphingobium xenophagum TaxID=121428 RepID=A0A401J7F0_SPHXE|nr:hypothetical protein MBESOW_P3741 [Sphingobium xenophagum]